MLTLYLTAHLFFFRVSEAAVATSRTDSFQKGLAAYQERQYDVARDQFEKSLSEDGENPRLFHNLALTHFQLNEKAKALAYWRKALVLDPGFRAARTGRDLLESRYNMRPLEKDPFSSWLRRLLEWVSALQLLWVLAALITVTGWLWIRHLASRRLAVDQEEARPPIPLAAVASSLIVVVLAAVVAAKIAQTLSIRATVVTDHANARSLPADDGVSLFDLTGGTEVEVRRHGDGWLQVRDRGGSTGWLKESEAMITSGW